MKDEEELRGFVFGCILLAIAALCVLYVFWIKS